MPATTHPTIRLSTIQTSDIGATNGVTLEFEYLPESLSFSTSATFDKTPFTGTAVQYLIYRNSTLNDISVDVKVVAGCNNAIVSYDRSSGSVFSFGTPKAAKSTRNDLVTIAQLLYSLTLPPTNEMGSGRVPPYCSLVIGPYCGCMGYMETVNIKFGGPYDWDGSPTEMDVSLTFAPTEFNAVNDVARAPSLGGKTSETMDGNREVAGYSPYAFWVGQNIDPAAPPAPAPTYPTITNESQTATLSGEMIQRQAGLAPGPGPARLVTQQTGTYTPANIAEAYNLPIDWYNPDQVNNQIRRYQDYDPTTHQPTGPYFYDIATIGTHISEQTVNNYVHDYQQKNDLKTGTTTTFSPTAPPGWSGSW